MGGDVRPFRIDVPEARLARIRQALVDRELPPAPDDDAGWEYGVDVRWLNSFLGEWAAAYDWRAQEAALNLLPQVTAEIDGLTIHAFHIRGSSPRPRPVILTHGWPGSPFEFMGAVERLAHPERFGGSAEEGLDLVIPCLPGVGFSSRPPAPIGPRRIAQLWRTLMVDRLGYSRFAAQGGDLGSAVSSWLGADHADVVAAVHLNLVVPQAAPDPDAPDEVAWRNAYAGVQQRESAYMMQHMTKPQTVAVALDASPVAFAAWVLEKFATWADTGGDIDSRFSRDDLIANLMFYLATGSAGTSIWLYRGAANERAAGRFDGMKVAPPTACALYPKEFLPHPPRAMAEKSYNIVRWTEMPAGGHFAAFEEPEAFADDLRAFLTEWL